MPSLKEVKGRIASVTNTRKITSAMKMVASSKLHKAQQTIENMLPYETQMSTILGNFLSGDIEIDSVYTAERAVKKVALVVYASNSSLCGGFNANVIKSLTKAVYDYKHLGKENIIVYPIGRKVADAVKKLDVTGVDADYSVMAEHPSFKTASEVVEELMQKFVAGEIDKVEIIYNHFKNTASQVLRREVFLPIELDAFKDGAQNQNLDYIVEPSKEEVVKALIPTVLHLKIYTALLDSNASEHAARTVAMQTATDNADDLLQELTLMYNKSRQQAITSELLDIVAGSMNH